MPKIAKFFIVIVVFIIVVPLTALWLLSLTLDKQFVVAQVQNIVKQQTGGQLYINGQLDWSIYPQISLAVTDLEYAEAEQDKPMASIKDARFGLALAPLLSKQIQIEQLLLSGVTIVITEQANTAYAAKAQPTEQTSPAAASIQSDASSNQNTSTIEVASVELRNISLTYQPLEGDTTTVQIELLTAIGANNAGNPFDLTMAGSVNQGDTGINKIALSAALGFNAKSQILSAKNLKLSSELSHSSLQNPEVVTLDAGITTNLENGSITLSDAKIQLLGIQMTLALSGTTGDTLALEGKLTTEKFDAKNVLAAIGTDIKTAKPGALSSIGFGSDLSVQDELISLSNTTMYVDDTNITGDAHIELGERLNMQSTLHISAINLDDYLPPADIEATSVQTSNSNPKTPQSKNQAKSPTPLSDNAKRDESILPLDALRGVSANLSLTADKMVISDSELSSVNTEIVLTPKQLALKTLNAKIHGGSLTGNATISLQQTPVINSKVTLTDVSVQSLAQQFGDIQTFTGQTNANATITTQGNSMNAWQSQLNGNASLDMTDVVIQDIDLEQMVCTSIAKANNQQLARTSQPQTKLDSVTARLRMVNGVLTVDKLNGGIPGMSVNGSGQVDPLKDAIDLRLSLNISGQTIEEDTACEVNQRYRDIAWPVRCRGKLSGDSGDWCGIDQGKIDDVIRDLAKKELRRKAKDKLGEALLKFLQ